MCLDGSSYVAGKVYERLTAAGVAPERAAGVAAKVALRYREKRSQALARGPGTSRTNHGLRTPKLDG